MRKLRMIVASVVLILGLVLANAVQAQLTDAEALSLIEATTPTAAADVPEFGTFYSAQNPDAAPSPADVIKVPAWSLGGGFWLLDDVDYDYAAQTGSLAARRGMSLDDLGGDDLTPALSFPTNGLYLQITNVANGQAYLNLMNATDYVYEVFSKSDLGATNWDICGEVFPADTNCQPFNLPLAAGSPSRFIWARDWTGITSNGNETPEWWFYFYFGTTALSDTNLDSLGMTLLYDYLNGVDPNVIQFSLQFTNDYVNTGTASGTVTILGGVPSYIAVLVNDTNQADASWQPYTSTNIAVTLGSTNGIYHVQVGLRGLPAAAQQTWLGAQLTLNNTGPALTLTNPVIASGAATTVSVPMIQLQGYADEPLSSLTFDVSNAAGIFTNQTGYLTDQYYDTNLLAFTTNYFQCYDVQLTNGVNSITLHATDLAGNETTTSVSYTLDYSGDTNPPALTLIWPPDGTVIAGTNFTMQAQVDDNTATVTASIVDTNGDTNIVQGLVERGGAVWVNNLPLTSGTNWVTVRATDAAGNMSATNFSVVGNDTGLTVDPLTDDNAPNQASVTVTGTINDPDDNVSVNGVAAYVYDVDDNGVGYWEADGVPVSPTGTAGLDVELQDGDGNPIGEQNMGQAQPATVTMMSYESSYHLTWYGGDGQENDFIDWSSHSGGMNWGNDVLVNHGDDDEDYSYEYPIAAGLGAFTTYTFSAVNEKVSAATASSDGSYSLQAQSQLMIVPSGQQPIGASCLYLVGISALAYSDPQNGYVFDRQSGDVPVADPTTLQLNGQSLINSGLTNEDGSVTGLALLPAPAGANVPLAVGSATVQNYSFQTNLLQEVHLAIIDANSGQDLTAQTNTVIVGQQMNWYAQLAITNSYMTNFPLANFQWSVPGYAISNYVVASDSSSAMVVTNFPLNNTNVVFYWVDGGLKQVQVSATIDGKTVTGQATFSVLRPTTSVTTLTGTVALDSNFSTYSSGGTLISSNVFALHYGSPNITPGITFFRSIMVPNGFSGDTEWIQLIDSNFKMAEVQSGTNGVWYSQQASNVLDTVYPYPVTNSFTTSDSPGIQTTNTIAVSDSQNFTMWIMFRPTGGQWVPLRSVNWSWGGSASLSGTNWTLTSSSNTADPSDANSTAYPQWTNNIVNFTFQPE